ncbi:sigma-54 dependent transcriptional regulator [Deltaproteobacteria bacterium TL4]
MKKILIIDDDASLCYGMKRVLTDQYRVDTAGDSCEALDFLKQNPIDLILLDYRLGEEDGLEVLKKIKTQFNEIPVIFMTGFGTSETVLNSINFGASDYVVKPIEQVELEKMIQKHLPKNQKNKDENAFYIGDYPFHKGSLVGSSPAINSELKIIARASGTDSPVLITGESGTGKELVATLIHQYSPRKNKNFVAINCAAIPENLLESELFGYAKGAFSGAYQEKPGKFEFADKGTVFLDEIGDMSLNLQIKLLRVLQEKNIEKLGQNSLQPVDVRVIAATNHDLPQLIREGTFREELFYRLDGINIELPPLRERKTDMKELLIHFTRRYAEEMNKPISHIDHRIFEKAANHSWPGNIRELQNAIRRAVILSSSTCLELEDFKVRSNVSPGSSREDLNLYEYFSSRFSEKLLEKSIEALEKELLLGTLLKNRFHLTKSAEELDISRVTLNAKIKKYDFSKKASTDFSSTGLNPE